MRFDHALAWSTALTVALVATFTLVASKSPGSPPAKPVIKADRTENFTQRFVVPTPVRTIPIVKVQAEPVPVPPPKPAELKSELKPAKRASRGDDICARHHMRKVMVNRYSWRCRR